MGSLSDSISKKSILIISFLGSALSYLILGFTCSIIILFMSRLIVGAVKQTLTTTTAMIATLPSTNEENLSQRIALMKVCSSLGFIVGPLLGGYLSEQGGNTLPTVLAAALFLVDSLIALFFIHEETGESSASPSSDHSASSQTKKKPSFLKSLGGLKSAITNPATRRWLLLSAILSFSFWLVRSNLSLANKDRFGISSKGNGLFMSVLGGASVLTQSVGLPLTTKLCTSIQGQILAACVILITAYMGNVWASTFEWVMVYVCLMVLGNGILSTVITARYSQELRGKVGSGMGVSSALQSLVGVIAPTLGGFMYRHGGSTSSSLFAASVIVLILGWVLLNPAAFPHGQKSPNKKTQ